MEEFNDDTQQAIRELPKQALLGLLSQVSADLFMGWDTNHYKVAPTELKQRLTQECKRRYPNFGTNK